MTSAKIYSDDDPSAPFCTVFCAFSSDCGFKLDSDIEFLEGFMIENVESAMMIHSA